MKHSQRFSKTLLWSAVCLAGMSGLASAQSGSGAKSDTIEEVLVVSQRQPYRGDVPLEALPQQVQVIGGDLLAQAGIIEFQNALDMAGGVARQNTFGGLWDSFAIRGFAGDENVPSGYLINGFSGGRGYSGNRDTSNVESIEVLKGPGSALFGRGEPGGTINIVTKKPQFETEGYVKASVGRWDTYRAEGDYTTGLSEKLAFRINGAYEDSESFRDFVTTEKLVFTPSFLYAISSKTTLSYELEYLNQETPFDRGIIAVNRDPEVLPVERFMGEPADGPIEIKAIGHQLVLQHDMDSGIDLLVGLGYRESSFEGFASQPELAVARQFFYVDGQTLTRQRNFRDYDAEDISGRVELSGNFETGPFTHHMLVGVDYYTYELESFQTRFRPGAGTTTYSINIYNPVYGQPLPTNLAVLTNQLDEQNATGIYFQDQIDLSEKWKMLLGVRYDDFEQDFTNRVTVREISQADEALSPRAGLVFEANENISLYASYSEGFRPNGGTNFAGNAFEPEESESFEAGIKWSNGDDTLNGTLAFFQAEKSNILTADPVNTGFSEALGEAESEGFEIDVHGQLSDTLRFWFAYAYVKAETSNDVINFDWGVAIPSGSPLVNIPEHSGNLTVVKDFTIVDQSASLGVGINYVDDRLGETIDQSYILPSYTLVKVFGSYDLTSNIRLGLNVDNLLDEEHYVASYSKLWTMPGTPRSYNASIQYSF